MSSSTTPLAPVTLAQPIYPRISSDEDRTAAPTPVDSGSVHEESTSTSTSTSQNNESEATRAPTPTSESPELKPKKEQDQANESGKGKKDEWTYENQLKVSIISPLPMHETTHMLIPW